MEENTKKQEYPILYSETYQKLYSVWGKSPEEAKERLYNDIGEGRENPPEECADSAMTVLEPFYFTFGSDAGFPYQNGYLVIYAKNKSLAYQTFRKHFADRHHNCANYSFCYSEEGWHKTGMENLDNYPCYETIYATDVPEPAPENIPREFYIDTPFGKLKVYAKHKTDTPADYPGVFVDFIDRGGEEIPLACTEYDPNKNVIQTCVYGDGLDDSPTDVVCHRNLQVED